MKKLLCGTTALVAATLVAGEESAVGAGLKLGIAGFYRNAIGGSFGNSPTTKYPHGSGPGGAGIGTTTAGLGNFDRQNVSMREEIRINFQGQTTLDNGITLGVLIGLNAESAGDPAYQDHFGRAFMDFRGKFGMIRLGQVEGALQTDCVGDPGNVTANFGVNSPSNSFSNVGFAQFRNQTTGIANVNNTTTAYFSTFGVAPMGSIGTCYGLEQKGNKLMYFTPSFDGFSLGVSFAPTGAQRRAADVHVYGTDIMAPGPATAGSNVLSVGADYTGSFEGLNLVLGGGGEWAFTQYTPAGGTSGNEPSWYQIGGQLGFGRFIIGASGAYYVNYAHDGYAATTASSSDDGWVVSAGASYIVGAWSLGLQGVYGSWQQNAAAILGVSVPGATADNEAMWGLSLNSAYKLSPGVSLEGQVAYTAADYGNLSAFGISTPVPLAVGVDATRVHSWEIDVGTAINF